MRSQQQHPRSRPLRRALHLEILEDRCLLSTYTITDLGSLGTDSAAYAINDAGMVVGESGNMAFGSQHAFLWDAVSGMQDLGTLGGPIGSAAFGINSKGSVVGEASVPDGHPHAFLYNGGPLIDLGTLGGPVSSATGVSDAGQVVGFAVSPFGFDPFLWDAEHGMQDLGTLGGDYSHAEGINASGTVVGFSGSPMRAFRWDSDNGMQDLGTLGGDISRAAAINAQGHIVGFARRADGYDVAFFYDGKQMIDIGQPSPNLSSASAINDSDQIVGDIRVPSPIPYHGFIYADGEMQDLNNLIPPKSGLILTEATGINNAGQIAGVAVDVFNHTRAVLLTPDEGRSPRSAVPGLLHDLATLHEFPPRIVNTAVAPDSRPATGGPPMTAVPSSIGIADHQATHAVFASSHPTSASVSASDCEIKDLEYVDHGYTQSSALTQSRSEGETR